MKTPTILLLLLTGCALLVLPCCVSRTVVRTPLLPAAPVSVAAGTSLKVLPRGYRTVNVDGAVYYVHGDRWSRRHSGRYVAVTRPARYRVPARRPARTVAVHRYRKH